MLKKFITTTLFFCLAALCQCFASAETEGDWEYEVYNGEFAFITGYSGNSAVVDIPRSLGGETVTEVYISCFDGHDEIKTVNFPAQIDNIYIDDSEEFTLGIENFNVSDENAYYCSLDGVIFDKSVSRIILYPSGKSDSSYALPDTVENIQSRSFYKAVFLKEIVLPESLENIRENAFEDCESLTSVTLPANFEIGDVFMGYFSDAFDGCDSLTDFFVGEGSDYHSVDGVLFDAAEETLIKYPPGRSDETYTVPDTVRMIGKRAFSGSRHLKEAIIPDTTEEIDSDAFRYCGNLENVRLPEGLFIINNGTFYGCENLKSVEIPDSVKMIDTFAFGMSGLEKIYIGGQINYISSGAFAGCKNLPEFTVSDDNEIYYTDGGVLFNASDNSLCSYPAGKQIEKYRIPDGIISIYQYAFSGCENLREVILTDNITAIPECCFTDCVKLSAVNNTGGVTAVGNSAFENTAITNNGKEDIVYIGDIAVGCGKNITEAEIKDGTRVLADNLFSECGELTYVYIPEGITVISDNAFSYCKKLEKADLPESLTDIGGSAFMFCTSLKSVTLPENVVNIGAYAFDGCSEITSVTIPKKVTVINTGAFENCSSLETIVLPEGIKEIGFDSFSRCHSLKNINLPRELETIGNSAFFACHSLDTVEIPENVTVISNSTFYSCDSLRNVFFYDGISEIEDNAFENCGMLDGVYYEGTENQWEKIVIGENNENLTGAEFYPDSTALDAWSAGLPDSTSLSVTTRNDGIGGGNALSLIIGVPSVIILVIGLTVIIVRKIRERKNG